MEIDQDTPRMTPEELRQAGEILYGTHWQSELVVLSAWIHAELDNG